MKKILLVVAFTGFQQQEYFDTRTILEKGGCTVITASNHTGIATAKDGSSVAIDVVLDAVDPKLYDGIFFIGGPGTLENLDTQESNRILNEAMILQIPYGAICIAPRILARAHVLVGRQATGWNNDNQLGEIFSQNNVELISNSVVVDGNVVTGDGPHAAVEFGKAILGVL